MPAPCAGAAKGQEAATYLLSGVLRPSSIATAVARQALGSGARVLLTAPPVTKPVTQALARRLGVTDPVLGWDAAEAASSLELARQLDALGVSRLDGVLHAVAHADPCLLGGLLPPAAGVEDQPDPADSAEQAQARSRLLERAFTVSTASPALLAGALRDLLSPGGDLVVLSFDSSHVHSGYGWMGPLKAGLEAVVRSLAVEMGPLGVRVNAVSPGPLPTPAAQAVPGFEALAQGWGQRAPLGWGPADSQLVARTVLNLLSGGLPATTGQVITTDGGASLVLQ